MLASDLKRENFSVNLKSKPTEKLDLSATIRYSNTKINGGGTNEQNEVSSADSRLKNAVLYTPFYVPGLTVEDPDATEDGSLINPYTTVSDNDRQQERRNYNIQGSLGYKIIRNLSKQIALKLNISINTVNRHRQNILEKLNVGNSIDAMRTAKALRLL